MAFPPQFLDEIRARVPLAEVIGRRTRLIRRGREHVALCPFHNEKTPSFTVSEEKGFFHCFGCGAHGDVIGFVMRDEGLNFPEAVEKLAGHAGLAMPKETPQARERARAQISLYGVLEAATKWFEGQLKSAAGRAARDYLERRGLSAETIKAFRLGFAPDRRDGIKAALAGEEISEALMVTAGLLIEGEGEKGAYDRFRGRIIFPITDRRGRVIAFGGRAVGDVQPKYLNSPDTPLFHKGAVLYGLPAACGAARKARRVIAVEGYMDVIALHQAGIAEVMAPLGTAVTELQLEELWRLAEAPILCFDGDQAGERAAFRAVERALPRLRSGRGLRFAGLPQGEDPDSLVNAGGVAAMEEVLAGAEPLSALLWKMAGGAESLESPEQRAAVNRRLGAAIERIPDRDLQFYYQRHFRVRLYEGGTRQGRPAPSAPRQRPEAKLVPQDGLGRTPQGNAARRERTTLQTVLNFPGLVHEFHEDLARFPLATPRYRALRDALLELDVRHAEPTKAGFSYHLTQAGLEAVVDELVGQDARYLDWAARDSGAAERDARTQLRHVLDLHRRLGDLESEREAAEQALAADFSDANWRRLVSAVRAVSEAPGTEALLPGYGENSEQTRKP